MQESIETKTEQRSETQVAVVDKKPPAVVEPKTDITDRVIESWNQMQRMAQAFSSSGLIPDALRGKFNDILVILQMSKELDIPPMQGICGINVIQGKPSIAPQMMLALIYQRVPGCVIEFRETTPTCAKVYMARSKEAKGFESVWDIPRATSMGLTNKDNYKKQPGTMLKWRAVGEAARTIFPDVVQGFYVREELIDLEPQSTSETAKQPAIDLNAVVAETKLAQ